MYNSLSNAEGFDTSKLSDIKKYFDDNNIKNFSEIFKDYDHDVITIRSNQISITSGKTTIRVQHDLKSIELPVGSNKNINDINNYVLDEQNLQIKLKVDDKEYIITSELEGEKVKYFLNIEGYKVKIGSIINNVSQSVERGIHHKLNQLGDRIELLESKKSIEDIADTKITNEDYDNTINRIKQDLLAKGVREETWKQFNEHLESLNDKIYTEYVNEVEENLAENEIEFDHSKFDLAKIKGAKSNKFFSIMAIYDLIDSAADLKGLGDSPLNTIFGINGLLDAMDDVRESLSTQYANSDGKIKTRFSRSGLGKITSKIPTNIRKSFVRMINNPVVQGITFVTITWQFGHSIDQIIKGENVALNSYFATSSGVKLTSMSMKPISIGVMTTTRGLSAATKISRILSITSKVLGKISGITVGVDFAVSMAILTFERLVVINEVTRQIPLTHEEQVDLFFAKFIKFFTGKDIEDKYSQDINIKSYLEPYKLRAIELLENDPNIGAVVNFIPKIKEAYSQIIGLNCDTVNRYTNVSFNANLLTNQPHGTPLLVDLTKLNISDIVPMQKHTLVPNEDLEKFECELQEFFNKIDKTKCFNDIERKKVYIFDINRKYIPYLNKNEYCHLGIRFVQVPELHKIHECGDIINDKKCIFDLHGNQLSFNDGSIYKNCTNTFLFSPHNPFILTNPARRDPYGDRNKKLPKQIFYMSKPSSYHNGKASQIMLNVAENYPAIINVMGNDIMYVGSQKHDNTFIINDHGDDFLRTLQLGAASNTIIMNDNTSDAVTVDLISGRIFQLKGNSHTHTELRDLVLPGITYYNKNNYISNSAIPHNMITNCQTEYVNVRSSEVGNEIRHGSINCNNEDHEIRVVNRNDKHYTGLKRTTFVISSNSDRATINHSNSVSLNNNTDVIYVQDTNLAQLRISENTEKDGYNLELLDSNRQKVVASIKVDNFKNLVMQTMENRVIKTIMVHNKSPPNIIEDMRYQMLDSSKQNSLILQNSQKKLKAIVQVVIPEIVRINPTNPDRTLVAYEVAKDITDHINLGIPVSYVEVITDIAAVPGPKVIINSMYSEPIVIDYNYHMQNYTKYRSKGGRYSEGDYIKKCSSYYDIMAEGSGQYVIKLPNDEYSRHSHTFRVIFNENTCTKIDLSSNLMTNITLPTLIAYFTNNACDSSQIGSSISYDTANMEDAVFVDVESNKGSIRIILLNYLKGPEYQNITFQFNKGIPPVIRPRYLQHDHDIDAQLNLMHMSSVGETEEYSLNCIRCSKRSRRSVGAEDEIGKEESFKMEREGVPAASSGARQGSWLNDLFGWVKSSIDGLMGSRIASSKEVSNATPQVDTQFSYDVGYCEKDTYQHERIWSNGQQDLTVGFSDLLSNENTLLLHCVADVMDRHPIKRYQDLRNKGVEVVPSTNDVAIEP